jgi:protein-S-isoprenylcysteine O-methyltransferase Ste14
MSAFVRFIWFPAVIILLTLAWIWLDSATGWKGLYLPKLGTLFLIAGITLAGWCSHLFWRVGKGSPHPFTAKTKNLVTTGPYSLVRNPMMWGVGSILAGLALLLGSIGLWLGFSLFLLFVRWFVPCYKERDMERRFGAEYREYCLWVPRWWPRFSLRKPSEPRRKIG